MEVPPEEQKQLSFNPYPPEEAPAAPEQKLLYDLTLFRMLLDQSNDAIEVIDAENLRLLDVNQKECVDLGYSRQELLDDDAVRY